MGGCQALAADSSLENGSGNASSSGSGPPIILTVIRSRAWGLDFEDTWEVEVPAAATVADFKAVIEDLYNVVAEAQLLTLSPGASVENQLNNDVKVQSLKGKKVYLEPRPLPASMMIPTDTEQAAALAEMAEILNAAQAADHHMEDALRDVKYKVTFERPPNAGGRAAGKRVQMELPALELVGTAQQLVELEMFGEIGAEAVFMVLEGELLPTDVPLFHAGVEEGTTVILATEPPPLTEEEQQMFQLLAARGGVPLEM